MKVLKVIAVIVVLGITYLIGWIRGSYVSLLTLVESPKIYEGMVDKIEKAVNGNEDSIDESIGSK